MIKKRCNITAYILCILLGIAVIVTGMRLSGSENKRIFLQSNIDRIFQSGFSQLCNNLNVVLPEDAESRQAYDEQNLKYAFLCMTIQSSTSYSEDAELNNIVLAMSNLCEKGTLYGRISPPLADKCKRLSYDISNRELAKSVYDEFVKIGLCK